MARFDRRPCHPWPRHSHRCLSPSPLVGPGRRLRLMRYRRGATGLPQPNTRAKLLDKEKWVLAPSNIGPLSPDCLLNGTLRSSQRAVAALWIHLATYSPLPPRGLAATVAVSPLPPRSPSRCRSVASTPLRFRRSVFSAGGLASVGGCRTPLSHERGPGPHVAMRRGALSRAYTNTSSVEPHVICTATVS